MTLNELTYTIWKKVKPRLSDDSDLTRDNIKHDISAERSMLVWQQIRKGRPIHDALVQDLGCLELEIADAAECCDFTTGCKVLRTKKKLPSEIKITRVGPVVKTKARFKLVTYEEAIASGNGRFNQDTVYAYHMNDRVYLKGGEKTLALLEYINVRGVFEDPRDASEFSQCGSDKPYYSDDSDYPMPGWMETIVRDKLVKVYLQSESIPLDMGNDSKDQSTD